MRQTGFTAEDYKERVVTSYYLGRSEPIFIFTSPEITNRRFFEARQDAVASLNAIVEKAIQAAKSNNHLELGKSIGFLHKLGEENNLRGISDLARELKEYLIKKPKGILSYYGLEG